MDPNNLTVDKLKKELSEHNVPLPKYPKKEILVELYRMNVPNSAGKTGAYRLEFSDEDEVLENAKSRKSLSAVSKRRSVTTRSRDEAVFSSSGINVSNMSDAELMETLQQHGADVGPVTETTRTVYEKKLVRLLDNSPRKTAVLRISPLKNKVLEEKPAKRVTDYSDEDEDAEEEEEEDEEEEEEGYRNHDDRQQKLLFDKHGNKDYEDSFTIHSRYAASNESCDPPNTYTRHSMGFSGRPPLSSFDVSDAFTSRPLSSGLTSTTRRSHVYTSSEYSSAPRSTPLAKDSLLPGAGTSRGSSHVPQQTSVPKQTEKKRGKCFWLVIFFILLLVLVLAVVIWNMDPAFPHFALPANFEQSN